jgi:hypothetical protein
VAVDVDEVSALSVIDEDRRVVVQLALNSRRDQGLLK